MYEEYRIKEIYASLLELIVYLPDKIRGNSIETLYEDIKRLIDNFEKWMFKHNYTRKEIEDIKYAFVATIDEKILLSSAPIKNSWAKHPLQMEYFNENSAGEGFYKRLENIRLSGEMYLSVLEFYYWCLELGFKGKYLIHGVERINNLIRDVREQLLSHMQINSVKKKKRPIARSCWFQRLSSVLSYKFVVLSLMVGGIVSFTYFRYQQSQLFSMF